MSTSIHSFAYGGESGGGSVNIFYGTLIDNSTITATGGQGRAGNGTYTIRRSTSGSGGNGSVTLTEFN